MAYPDFPQLVGSTEAFKDGRVFFRDEGGGAHAASLYDDIKSTFTLKHQLNGDDVATLKAFYAANLTTPFDFTWALDGVTYSCIFGAGGVKITPGSVWHDVMVELEQA